MKSLVVCCFKTLVSEKAECTLAMGKDKKRKLFGVTFSFNKEKRKFWEKNVFTIYWIADWNILRTRMNKMISHLLSEVFSSHAWKITVFPQLALLPLVVQYPLSGIKAELYPSAPPTPPQRKFFSHLCVKDLFTLPWNSFLTTCLQPTNCSFDTNKPVEQLPLLTYMYRQKSEVQWGF